MFFWHQCEVKKVQGTKGDMQKTVDCHTPSDFIADLFANKYIDLYTSVRYDQTEMIVLRQDIDGKVDAAGYISSCIVNGTIYTVIRRTDCIYAVHKSSASFDTFRIFLMLILRTFFPHILQTIPAINQYPYSVVCNPEPSLSLETTQLTISESLLSLLV